MSSIVWPLRRNSSLMLTSNLASGALSDAPAAHGLAAWHSSRSPVPLMRSGYCCLLSTSYAREFAGSDARLGSPEDPWTVQEYACASATVLAGDINSPGPDLADA
jgi:hypothetical protein